MGGPGDVLTADRRLFEPEGRGPAEAERVRVAARATTSPELLHLLAADPAPTVRAAVALNPTFAPQADHRLMEDADERIRTLLAGKLARLLPGLPGQQRPAVQAHVQQVLMALASDAAVRVRKAIADAVSSLPDAPRELIRVLSQDQEIVVSEPVMRFSPQLTDADLLDLLATPPHAGTATAIASRIGLSAAVADDIAAHADGVAIRTLLENGSATIQEATLDALIGRAGDHPEWHEPLVCRPALPMRALRALSLVVAGHLLEALVTRTDLTADQAAALRSRVTESLSDREPPSEAAVLDGVRRLNASGRLNEGALLDAVSAGEPRQAAAILAACSGVPLSVIDRAVGLRSAKALVSIVAKAGFPMTAAMAIQGLLGRLSPGEMLHPAPDGGYPLTPDEISWHIELLTTPGGTAEPLA